MKYINIASSKYDVMLSGCVSMHDVFAAFVKLAVMSRNNPFGNSL